MATKGIFLSFEGGEACGKSTQIRLLDDYLRREGRETLCLREPGGTAVGEQIRQTLQYSKDSSAMVPEAELLLFAASRAQLVREAIRPALQEGKVVLCDRFVDSTTVYQGVARNLDRDSVAWINQFAIDGLLPDLTFLLDLDLEDARSRMAQRKKVRPVKDRMEEQEEGFYYAVRDGYLELAEQEVQRIVLIDASAPVENVAFEIRLRVKEFLHGLTSN